MAGVNWRFEISIKPALNGFLMQMMRSSVVEVTSCVYIPRQLFFSISYNSGGIFNSISKSNC